MSTESTRSDVGDGAADPATKDALRYRTALRDAFESLTRRPLSTATAVRVCSIIELVELIFTQPYCRIANLVDAGIAQRQSASTYKALVELGVLHLVPGRAHFVRMRITTDRASAPAAIRT